MAFPISYDITRLGSRVFTSSHNGVHRVDAALARHFLTRQDRPITGTWFPRPLAHRIVGRKAALEVLEGVDGHLLEGDDPGLEPLYRTIKDWLLRSESETPGAAARIHHARKRRVGDALAWTLRHGIGTGAARGLPKDARYVNASHYGLAVPGAFDWLARRPDVRAVFFLHDMLPFETPEYFIAAERARHENRLRNLARHGAGAIVSTRIVKASLEVHLARLGRRDLPVLAAPPPVAPIFHQDFAPDAELAARPYFIQCGTIEPRKNHLTMLHVWRELVARHGVDAPRLVLIGARGWENENILDLLERAPGLRRHVLEVSGLPTPVLRRLMSSARALLMPSFAEGFGLPLAEAIAAGAPAIASDIPVFREIAGGAFLGLSPIDGEGWLNAIEAYSGLSPNAFAPVRRTERASDDSEHFFSIIESFVDSL
jgi:glycosyltransferase involved in cell wall biosynthesis